MAITSANQLELLQTAEAVAREKMIDPVLVIKTTNNFLVNVDLKIVVVILLEKSLDGEFIKNLL